MKNMAERTEAATQRKKKTDGNQLGAEKNGRCNAPTALERCVMRSETGPSALDIPGRHSFPYIKLTFPFHFMLHEVKPISHFRVKLEKKATIIERNIQGASHNLLQKGKVFKRHTRMS